MKKFVSILIIFLVSIVTLHKSLVFAFYELDRDYVVEQLCINKDNPDSDCHGKCFLMKQTNEKEAEGVLIRILKNIDLDLFLNSQPTYTFLQFKYTNYKIDTSLYLSKDFVTKIIKPPIFHTV